MQIQSGFKSGSTHEIMNSGTHTSGVSPRSLSPTVSPLEGSARLAQHLVSRVNSAVRCQLCGRCKAQKDP